MLEAAEFHGAAFVEHSLPVQAVLLVLQCGYTRGQVLLAVGSSNSQGLIPHASSLARWPAT